MAKDENEKADRQPLPPYVSFKTVEGVIQKFKETTVPDNVDPSVLRTYSNSVARQVISAMKYLDMINEKGKPTDRLIRLRNAYDTTDWQPTLTEVIYDAYRPLIDNLNLERATPAQLDEKFKKAGADGEVLEKCVAFYVAAMRAAGAPLSPYILNRPRKRPERRGRPKKAQTENGTGETPEESVGTIGSSVKFSFPIPSRGTATFFVPAELTIEDWQMVDTMMRAYIERRKKA